MKKTQYQLRNRTTEKVLCQTEKIERIRENPRYQEYDNGGYYIAKVNIKDKKMEIIEELTLKN